MKPFEEIRRYESRANGCHLEDVRLMAENENFSIKSDGFHNSIKISSVGRALRKQ